MKPRKILDGIYWMGVIDWNRRLFDSLIPLPDGTTYNAYLIKGSEKTVLLDTVEPELSDTLLEQLSSEDKIDYIISHHAEQDHSGTIPKLLKLYEKAIVICSVKAKDLLIEHINIDPKRIRTVSDGESLSLGDKTLKFIYTPWVHWPETMSTYLIENRILFSCDFFGSHFASSELFADNDETIYKAAKRYYAEIMMPFRKMIQKNIEVIKTLKIDYIAPSHGPIYNHPASIISKYEDWIKDGVENKVIIAYVSMHGSTKNMVDYFISALEDRGIRYQLFELSGDYDIGKLAISLVDASTIVIGTPTVNIGPHPNVVNAVYLVNSLRPKLRYSVVIGSYGWSSKAVDQITSIMSNLKLEIFDPVYCKGQPGNIQYQEIDSLADKILDKHSKL